MDKGEISFLLYGDVNKKYVFLEVRQTNDNDKTNVSIIYDNYILTEGNQANIYYLFRKDDAIINCVTNIHRDIFQNYICLKSMRGELDPSTIDNIDFALSDDRKGITITVYEKEKKESHPLISSLVKSLFKKSRL